MIEVELPDGTIAEFPEGTAPDVIKGALQKRFAAPQTVAPVVDQAGQDRAAYDELPWYAKAGQAADDVMRLAANGATFGYADKLAGYMSGDGTESERALTEQARNRAGSAAPVAEIGGSVLTAGGLAKNGLTLAGRGGTAAMTGLKGLAARAGLMGLEGEAFNKVSSMGYDQEYVPGLGVAAGAGGQVAGEGLSAGLSKILGAFNKAPTVMGSEQLKKAGIDALDRADASGIMFTPQGMTRVRDNAVADMADFGFHPKNQPGAANALEELDRLAGQNVNLKGVHTARKLTQGGFSPQNPSNNEALGKIVDRLDEALSNPQAGDVVGNVGAANKDFSEFKDLYSRGSKMQKVEDLIDAARLRAGSTGSGGNVDNATRQNLRQILTNKKTGRGFTADEKAAIEKVVIGTKGQNLLRLAGKLSPSGNGLMAALGVGGAMMNPALGAVSLGGMGAKAIADKQTRKSVEKLIALISAGGKASALQAPKNTAQKAIEGNKDAIIRALMMSGVLAGSQAGQP